MGSIKRFALSNSFLSFGSAVVMPFFIVFVIQLAQGNLVIGGYILAISMLIAVVTAPLWGILSDRIGRRGILIISGLIGAYTLYQFSLISNLSEIYLWVVIGAISGGMQVGTIGPLKMDLTEGGKQGTYMGAITVVVDIAGSIATLIGGFLIGSYGFPIVFQIAAIAHVIFVLPLFFVKTGGAEK